MTAVTEAAVEQALAALPTEADDIAALFVELGIKGQPRRSCACPMANYLLEEVPGARVVDFRVSAWVDGHLGETVQVEVPTHVREFVGRVDRGEYPELVGR